MHDILPREIFYTEKFLREYKKLPLSVKRKAEQIEQYFRKDIFDPILRTHKLKGKLSDFWSFSIDRKYRIIFEIQNEKKIIFHSVGNHDIYR